MNDQLTSSTTTIIGKLESWYETFMAYLPNLAVASLVLLISYFTSRLVYNSVLKLINNRIEQKSVTRLVARVCSILVVLLGLFLALSAMNLSKSLNGLLAGAGISGLVIGLALQGTLSNTFSGIVLSFRKTIKIGNWISTSGYEGEVKDIKLNYLVLREADNNIVVLPNKTILENPFKNFSLTNLWRVTLDCGVGYESDLEHVKHLAREVITAHFDQEELDKEFEFYYTSFGSSSIDFICRFWIRGKDGRARLKAKSQAMIELKKAFDQHDINIPFPIRTLQFENEKNLELVHRPALEGAEV
ncbi:MAG: mechanosensitive ion channel family protein [Flavobacteriaceae bacterium]